MEDPDFWHNVLEQGGNGDLNNEGDSVVRDFAPGKRECRFMN
jgi:hypothetical protein